jgi:GTP cyclohydrolase-4
MTLPDVQAYNPDVPINLTRVGVTNVKKIVEVATPDKPIILISSFDVFVDLPADIKGANFSRDFETVDEVLEVAINSPVYRVEDLCVETASRLLDRHEYASRAEVRMSSEYIMKRVTPVTKMSCQEHIDIFSQAKTIRGEKTRKLIGAEVVGMTVCPCTQEIIKEKAIEELRSIGVDEARIGHFMERIPMASHNQRGRGYISIDVENDFDVQLEKLVEIIRSSMSSEILELLKRPDEVCIIEKAHRNPVFVEDCVRAMAKRVVESFPKLPDDAIVTIKQTNEESIHQHNAFAERVADLGELRSELR